MTFADLKNIIKPVLNSVRYFIFVLRFNFEVVKPNDIIII